MQTSLNRTAVAATLHCLLGCSIGEILGMIIGGVINLDPWLTVLLSTALAFIFGVALTLLPLLRASIAPGKALKLAIAADALFIAIMEIVDNATMLIIPGAMDAPPHAPPFWSSMLVSLVLAGIVAFPLNRWLISRGRGHAVVHASHVDTADDHSHHVSSHEAGNHSISAIVPENRR